MTATILTPNAGSDSGFSVYALLNAATATGAGTLLATPGIDRFHSIQVMGGGTVPATACVVKLEGSLDGTNWAPILTWTLGTQAYKDIISLANFPVIYVRANLTTLTGGTAPTVTVLYLGTPG